MTQPESKLSSKIRTALLEEGAFVFKIWGSAAMMKGLPDLIGCVRGRFFGFEVKMPGKEDNTSPRQEFVHGLIRRAGGFVAIVSSKEEALDALNRCKQRVL